MKALKDIILTVTSFLTNNAPPNASTEEAERLRAINHLESKKFFACFVSIAILAFFYFTTVGLMFVLPKVPEIITGYVAVFTKTTEILAIVIAAYVGAQAAVDLKLNSSSSVSYQAQSQNITQHIEEEITIIHTNQKEDDYEIS